MQDSRSRTAELWRAWAASAPPELLNAFDGFQESPPPGGPDINIHLGKVTIHADDHSEECGCRDE